jgi:hypothetical protein
MRDEVAGLLEKTRALMREHTGSMEVVRDRTLNELVREKSPEAAERYRDAADRYREALVERITLPSKPAAGWAAGRRKLFVVPDRYAYREEDRERATELELQSRDLAQQYRTADDEAGRKETAAKLKANLNELFDLKLKGYQDKMSSIESELERLRQRVAERKKNKELIVTGRFKELVGEDNHLRW